MSRRTQQTSAAKATTARCVALTKACCCAVTPAVLSTCVHCVRMYVVTGQVSYGLPALGASAGVTCKQHNRTTHRYALLDPCMALQRTTDPSSWELTPFSVCPCLCVCVLLQALQAQVPDQADSRPPWAPQPSPWRTRGPLPGPDLLCHALEPGPIWPSWARPGRSPDGQARQQHVGPGGV
jgi:hypothetical protein